MVASRLPELLRRLKLAGGATAMASLWAVTVASEELPQCATDPIPDCVMAQPSNGDLCACSGRTVSADEAKEIMASADAVAVTAASGAATARRSASSTSAGCVKKFKNGAVVWVCP